MAESAKELEQVERFGSQAMQEEWLGVMSAKAKLTLIVMRALVMIIHEILTRLTHSIDITAASSQQLRSSSTWLPQSCHASEPVWITFSGSQTVILALLYLVCAPVFSSARSP
jgi:hypothetical protein